VRAVAYTPDGDGVLSAGQDHTARLWDRHTGRMERLFRGHTSTVASLACSPDGRLMATGGNDGTVIVHELSRDQPADTLPGLSIDSIPDLVFARDNRTLFACGGLRDAPTAWLAAWDAPTRRYLGTVQGPPPAVLGMAFLPSGKELLACESPAIDLGFPGVARLYDLATGRPGKVLRGHARGVLDAVATPDGGTLITTSGDVINTRRQGEIIFWDPKTLLPLRTVRAHRGQVGLFLSRDGKTLLSYGFQLSPASNEGELVLWDITSRTPRRRIEGEFAQVSDAALSPDGKLLAFARMNPGGPGLPSAVELRDEAGKPLVALTGHRAQVTSLLFAPDGKALWTAGLDGTVRVHEVPTGKLLRELPGEAGHLATLAMTPDGKVLAVGLAAGFVKLLDAGSGKEITRLPLPPTAGGIRINFGPDGRTLAASSSAGDLFVYDLPERRLRRLSRPRGDEESGFRSASALAVSPDGKTLATGGWDSLVRLWDVQPADPERPASLRQTIPAGGVVSGLAFTADGRTLARGTGGLILDRKPGAVTLLDLATGKGRVTLPARPVGIAALAVSPDGRTLAALTDHYIRQSRPSEVWLVDVATGKREVAYRGMFSGHSMAFSPDGRTLAFEHTPGSALLLELATKRSRTIQGHGSAINRMAFAPDSKSLATASADGTLKLWHVATGRELLSLPHEGRVESLAFSGDGRMLASSTSAEGRGLLRLWDAGPAEVVRQVWFADPSDGVARRQLREDEHGRLTEEAFFDGDGAPAVGPDGCHRRRFRRDESGKVLEEIREDAAGKPMPEPPAPRK
jgi:WD40 repeat protein